MSIDNLTTEQQIAVLQPGHVLLSACPGSGKTRTIIHKLAHEASLLDEHDKKKVVAVTFTVRASDEIYKRLDQMGIDTSKIWSGTLHAFCLEWILKPYSRYLPNLENGFSIIEEADKERLITDITNDYKTNNKLGSDIYIDAMNNTRITRDGFLSTNEVHERNILKTYYSKLQKEKLIDFDFMLYYSYKLLRDNSKIAKILSNIFHLICVDEYQDTQDLSYAIICSIINANDGNTALFLAGDLDQAVYHSLGGIAKSKLEIENELNGQVINELHLSGNFRSSQRVIEYYKHFQTNQIAIIARGDNSKEQGKITYNKFIHKDNIADEVKRLIQLTLNEGIPEHEICVLVPQWWMITSITKKLMMLLPNVSFDASGLSPLSKNKDNFWYKLSRLLLTEPSPETYNVRYKWATEVIDSFYECTDSKLPEIYNTERGLLRLTNTIKSSKQNATQYFQDCFEQFLGKIELDINHSQELYESWNTYFKKLEERIKNSEGSIPNLTSFFKNIYKQNKGIVINTCVGIKGEEFETVIAYGLLEGYVPHWNDIINVPNTQSTDRQKKLLYVICSRAKRNLHLISEQGRFTRTNNPYKVSTLLASTKFPYDI